MIVAQPARILDANQAHPQPEVGGGDSRAGRGLGFLRRHSEVPGGGQLPRRGGGRRRPASQTHPELHHRSGTGVSSQGQAPLERSIRYVRERFFKGGEFRDLAHLRDEAARWCRKVAGQRIHGTTRRKPLQVFLDEEREALTSWDGEPCKITHWRMARVHPDHHLA